MDRSPAWNITQLFKTRVLSITMSTQTHESTPGMSSSWSKWGFLLSGCCETFCSWIAEVWAILRILGDTKQAKIHPPNKYISQFLSILHTCTSSTHRNNPAQIQNHRNNPARVQPIATILHKFARDVSKTFQSHKHRFPEGRNERRNFQVSKSPVLAPLIKYQKHHGQPWITSLLPVNLAENHHSSLNRWQKYWHGLSSTPQIQVIY